MRRIIDNNRAVSPVIGVILLVAITVVIAAVVGGFVLTQSETITNGGSGNYIVNEERNGDELKLEFESVSQTGTVQVFVDGDVITTVESPQAGDSITLTGVDEGADVRLIERNGEGSGSQVYETTAEKSYGTGTPTEVTAGDGGGSTVSGILIDDYEDGIDPKGTVQSGSPTVVSDSFKGSQGVRIDNNDQLDYTFDNSSSNVTFYVKPENQGAVQGAGSFGNVRFDGGDVSIKSGESQINFATYSTGTWYKVTITGLSNGDDQYGATVWNAETDTEIGSESGIAQEFAGDTTEVGFEYGTSDDPSAVFDHLSREE